MKNNYLTKLYRPTLARNNRERFICMDKNEPPYSAFEIVDGILTDDDIKSLRIYPDLYELYEKLAEFSKINIEQLLITNGSEQAIEFVFRVFLEENDEVVYLNPSFAMFDVFAYQQKANVKYIEFENDISISIGKVLGFITHSTKLFVLANPNNPTGTAFNLNELKQIANHTKNTNTIFLLDEAYFHFYNIDSVSLVNEFNNIIITRTFSKALGIAGARVGYAISNSKNIELLRKLKPIDEINQLSNILAKKILDNIEMILEKNVKQVKKWKEIFKTTIFKNIQYIDTEGNFILLKSNSYRTHKELFLNNKILPKMDFSQSYLKNCFRFSVHEDKVMNKLIDIIRSE